MLTKVTIWGNAITKLWESIVTSESSTVVSIRGNCEIFVPGVMSPIILRPEDGSIEITVANADS